MIVKKRGLSPVIATVLLISIAVVLAIIIFLWAKRFVGETVEKFGEPVERACDLVRFNAEAIKNDGKVFIVNEGNVPLHGVEIKKKGFGSVQGADSFEETISNGETEDISLPSGIEINDNIVIIPIILGQAKSYKKPFICPEDYGVAITVT